jgi:ATP-dependent Clp protease protease subunit
MDAETWMNANKAIELGFADAILEDEKVQQPVAQTENYAFSRRAVTNSLVDKLKANIRKNIKPQKSEPEQPKGTPITAALSRLNLISGGNSNV